MGVLDYKVLSNLEGSLKEHLEAQISSESITLLNQEGEEITPDVRADKTFNTDWTLPVIHFTASSIDAPRLSIGSNKRQKAYTIIIDIRTVLPGQHKDLGNWVFDTINDGFTYYEFSKSGATATKTDKGLVQIDFTANDEVSSSPNDNVYDKYRWRITVIATINKT